MDFWDYVKIGTFIVLISPYICAPVFYKCAKKDAAARRKKFETLLA